MFELIKSLCALAGPVGQEGAVIDHMDGLWRGLGATTRRTRIGNLLATVPTDHAPDARKLVLVAHADELCYLVRSLHPGGFLYLANGQGWARTTDLRNAFTIGSRVTVLARSGPIPGVIASATGHVATLTLPDLTALTWDDFWVDTGLTREQLRARGVTPGTRIVWDASTELWGDHVVGKALDDRVPLAVMTEVLRRIAHTRTSWAVTLAATVQEEIGTIGAFAVAANTAFDAAIILEIGNAGDIPTVSQHSMPLVLGGGPGLIHKDAIVHYDAALTRALETCAADHSIPIQHAVLGSFGSDGRAFIQADVPSAMVVFPARYTHSPFETGHMRDIAAMVDWLVAFVSDEMRGR